MTKTEYVQALRELADYVDAREWPEKIQGWCGPQDTFSLPSLTISARNKTEFGLLCTSMRSFTKSRSEYHTGAEHTLPSGVQVLVLADRDVVCRKVVVGKRTVPASERIVEAVPEREVEIVEWECPESFIALAETNSSVNSEEN